LAEIKKVKEIIKIKQDEIREALMNANKDDGKYVKKKDRIDHMFAEKKKNF
jgi:hypothetical protein